MLERIANVSEWALEFLVKMTPLNQRVPGSSPGAPTNLIRHLADSPTEQTAHVLRCVLQFCSRFELHHDDLSELHVAAKIVGVEDRFDVA